ncbi:MAG: Cytochrome b5 reductase 4 [Cirrosporium novae-zelandiae]|nr:MAG: Cytochrome b5 reductase 4 [Cirrosporium novae-zelandiae]
MVLVGLGIILASLSFFIYRYPPLLWFLNSPTSLNRLESKPKDGREVGSKCRMRGGGDERSQSQTDVDKDDDQKAPSSQPSPQFDHTPPSPSSNSTASSQTTPKAKAVSSSTLLPVTSQAASSFDLSPLPPSIISSKPNSQSPNLMPPPSRRSAPSPAPSPRSSSSLAPPPRPSASSLSPLPRGGTTSLAPPASASSMRRLPNTPPTYASHLRASLSHGPAPRRKQTPLKPGHSPLDWATYIRSPNFPRAPTLQHITPFQLHQMNGRQGRPAWAAFRGKVYNITPYLDYHPGGRGELMRGAAKDAGRLFNEVHPWVSWEGLLGEACVGILVQEREATVPEEEEGSLEAMD